MTANSLMLVLANAMLLIAFAEYLMRNTVSAILCASNACLIAAAGVFCTF